MENDRTGPLVVKFTALDQQTEVPDWNTPPVLTWLDGNGHFQVRNLMLPGQWFVSIPELGVKNLVFTNLLTMKWDFDAVSAGPGSGTVELSSGDKTDLWGVVWGQRTYLPDPAGNPANDRWQMDFSFVGEFCRGPLKGVVLHGSGRFYNSPDMAELYEVTWYGTAIVPRPVYHAFRHYRPCGRR